MTPKFKSVASELAKLQHSLDYDAEKLMKRIAETDQRRERVFAKSHASVETASRTLDGIDEFVTDLERTNAGPLDQPTPRSSDVMSGDGKG